MLRPNHDGPSELETEVASGLTLRENMCHERWVPAHSALSSRGLGLASQRHVVECWIGVLQQTNRRVVRLAGRLSVAQVPELLGACAGEVPLEIDLTELVSADMAGIGVLQRLRDQGASVVGAPQYLQLKLDSTLGEPTNASSPKGGSEKK